MAKLVFGILMAVVWWMLHALQMDEELAMGTVHEAKRAVDRAAHAAAQQVDREKLEIGDLTLDPGRAQSAVLAYLRENLRLDGNLMPVPGSFLREEVRIEHFAVIGSEAGFPYTYRNDAFEYEVTLQRPGVVLIVHVSCPRLFGVMSPVEWDLKGSAEMVYD
ncbi:hypothetical protein GE107_25565 [Cohnella sp. CFH 77786]|uniref:hypothetical protein n=1 Tax=Cohnella sp. CFH 77786 TaxID=2662265 RepID=UPI001C60A96A|nr:hypothetical protein [Cohnella sp. CFH 77786]MBW5449399.1 hypothetical protein [Cohnella sp. CFH 77786]